MITTGYKRLQTVKGDYKGLPTLKKGCKWLQRVTRGYKRLLGVKGDYKGLPTLKKEIGRASCRERV